MAAEVNNLKPAEQTDKFLLVKMEGLTPEMIRKAKEELNETPENKREALKELKDLINAENDFRPIMADKFLLRFLRARKFNAKVALKMLKNFYTYKLRYSGMITDKLPSQIEHVFGLNIAAIMPHRDRHGSVIAILKWGAIDLNEVSKDELLALLFIVIEIFVQSEASQICGAVFIADLKGFSLRLLRQLSTPAMIHRFVRAFQDCLPFRLKAIHITNQPFYFSMAFSIISPFLSEKIKSRCQLHGTNFENLHKELPPEILPEEFDGHQGPLNSAFLAEEILGSDHHFSKISEYGYGGQRAHSIKRKNSLAPGLYQ